VKTDRRRPAHLLVALLAACALLLVACGDDDESSDTSSTDDSTTDGGGSDAASEEAGASDEEVAFCDAIVSVDAATAQSGPEGQVDPQVLTDAAAEIEANAPEALAAESAVLVETLELQAEDPEAELPEEFEAAYTAAGDFQIETCAFQEVTGSAIDYGFQDLPTEIEAGPTVIRLDNSGSATEFHEIVMLRVNDDVTETTEELLALPEEEALSKVEVTSVAFAPLGSTGSASADLEQGRYIAVCFLPVGSTPDAFAAGGPPEGPPHFLEGMVQEVTVG